MDVTAELSEYDKVWGSAAMRRLSACDGGVDLSKLHGNVQLVEGGNSTRRLTGTSPHSTLICQHFAPASQQPPFRKVLVTACSASVSARVSRC